MNRTGAAPDVSDLGRTNPCYKLVEPAKEERQEINESARCAKGASRQLLLEKKKKKKKKKTKKTITHRKVLESEIEPGVQFALNALAPIRLIQRLPDDVLCYIFNLHCKLEDSLPVTLPLNYPWKPTPQITLSRVCSAWRVIMLNVPTFWRSVRIVPRNLNTPQATNTVVKVANAWLSRAKNLPCSIDIDFPEDSGSWDGCRMLWGKDWHENIIRDLISLHKFKRLCVTFANHHLRDLLQLPDDDLSCVEDLCLRYISLNEDNASSPLDLHKLCNLTSFSLLPGAFNFYRSKGYFNFAGMSIPWHNLRHLHLRITISAPLCLDVLEHCSAVLETCSLVIAGDLSFTSSRRVPVHLFQLQKLDVIVHFSSGDEALLESFLLSLRFPNLKSLTLGPSKYPIILEMLFRVQDASQMQLEELIIPESTLDIDVRTLLMGFPSLRRLALPKAVTFTEDMMTEVGAGSIGTFLEDLTIRKSDLCLMKLLRMVKARSRAGDNEFKSVLLYCNQKAYEVEDDVRVLIGEIQRSGVNLDVAFWNYTELIPEESPIWKGRFNFVTRWQTM